MSDVAWAAVDRFLGDALGRGDYEPAALAKLIADRFGDEGRGALQAYRHALKGEIAKGDQRQTLASDEIEYVAKATATDALIGDVLLAWPKKGDDA